MQGLARGRCCKRVETRPLASDRRHQDMRGKADIEAPYPGSCSSPSMVSTRKLRTREPRARLGASGLDWHTFTSAGAVSPAPVVPLAQQVGVLKRAQPPCKQILTRSRKLRKTPCPDQVNKKKKVNTQDGPSQKRWSCHSVVTCFRTPEVASEAARNAAIQQVMGFAQNHLQKKNYQSWRSWNTEPC